MRADYAARQRAEQTERDRNMPLSELGKIVSVQNAQFRERRERNDLPTRTLRLESRPLMGTKFNISEQAQARANVALANPSLPRDGAEFSKLYALELSRLRS